MPPADAITDASYRCSARVRDQPSLIPHMDSFKPIFITVVLATALVVAAFLINSARPAAELDHPTAQLVAATGKCASCHRRETPAIVAAYETSEHAVASTNCLDCHQPQDGQQAVEHRGFTITESVTAKNCASCHAGVYDQFLRSRHAAPAYAAVLGSEPFTAEQIAFSESYHEGAVDRAPNALAALEGQSAITSGCVTCHAVGKPNDDGSIGTCTACHGRHEASIVLARQPQTCGQCHMGPDHSQLEIYSESKHGVMFNAHRDQMNLDADPKSLTVHDMRVPTCATCHMSGQEGLAVTHDVTERLSYWLFAEVSERRPTYQQGRDEMKAACNNCHTKPHTDRFFAEAENVLESTNEKVIEAKAIVDGLYADGLLTPEPFDEPIEFVWFDFWHYFGRTAKHGAFMGGADFVQWHGNYELLAKRVELEEMAKELRSHAR